MTTLRSLVPPLARTEEELHDEHRRLEELADRARSAVSLEDLAASLDEMGQALAAHFSHEERPQGFYDQLGLCGPAHRERLRGLLDDHLRMLAGARGLALRGRSLVDRARELRREAADFAEALRAHERREHLLAREALGSVPRRERGAGPEDGD